MKTLRKFGFVALFAAILFGLTGCPAPDNPHEHEWDNGVVTKPATLTEEGEKTFTCVSCGETKTEAIPKLEHEHDWDNGVVTKKATLTEEGEKTLTCVICGETRTEAIPKLWSDIENSSHITIGTDASYKGVAFNLDGEVPENAKYGRITITDVDGNFFEHDFDPTEKELRIPFVTAGEKYKASISWWTEDWALIGDNYNYVFDATDGIGFLKQTEKLTFTVKDGVLHCDKLPKYTVEPTGVYYVFNIAESNNKDVWNYLKWIGRWGIDSHFSVPDINIITELLNEKKTWSEKIIVLISFNLNYEGKSYSVGIHDYNDDYFDVPGGWKEISDKDSFKPSAKITISSDGKSCTIDFAGNNFLDGYFYCDKSDFGDAEDGMANIGLGMFFISTDGLDDELAKDENLIELLLIDEDGKLVGEESAPLKWILENGWIAINENKNQLFMSIDIDGKKASMIFTRQNDKSITFPIEFRSPEAHPVEPEQPAVSDTPGVPN